MPQKIKFRMKHVDGVTSVMATAFIHGTESEPKISYDYRYDGMDYGGTFSTKQAIAMGLIKAQLLSHAE